jgi:phosphoribosylformylglycinamidine cyclo-ligase
MGGHPKKMTYAEAGVDIKKGKRVHARIGDYIKNTFKFREKKFGSVVLGFGHYAGLIDIGGGKLLALHSDGVGTKVLLAQRMRKYDTVGIDCVAMNVNDLICMGAEPVALVIYLALQRPDEKMVAEITKGLVKGAEAAGASIVGGETAVMPDVIKGEIQGRGFDLAAMSVGMVEKGKVVTGERMRAGDVVVGLESGGIHSNGLTLARKVLLKRATQIKKVEKIASIEKELLKPTKIYVGEVLDILREVDVHGMAHITGGAFSKLDRIAKMCGGGFYLDSMPKPPSIFELIKKYGNVSDREMYRTFNMGVGFCIVVGPRDVDKVIEISRAHGTEATEIGKVMKEPGVRIKVPSSGKSTWC